jgi:hypothetical protein
MKGAGERNRENTLRTAVMVDLFIHVYNSNVGLIVEPRWLMVQVQVGM